MISNSSAIGVPSSQSAHYIISSMNNNNSSSNNSNNQTNISSGGGGNPLNGSSNNQNGTIVSHSQSAHQLGLTLQQTPLTPLAAHHQALQQQLQKHFANNNIGELFLCSCVAFCGYYNHFLEIWMTVFPNLFSPLQRLRKYRNISKKIFSVQRK
jgi:hypothetical protein